VLILLLPKSKNHDGLLVFLWSGKLLDGQLGGLQNVSNDMSPVVSFTGQGSLKNSP
jgi:hypothetical protein